MGHPDDSPTLSQRARNGGAARRGCVRCARVWKYPPFRKAREMVGQPDRAVFAARVWKYPPFRKEREMVGQPDGAVFAARGSGNTHPFAKSAKWWGSQTGLCSLRGSGNTHPFAKSAKWWGSRCCYAEAFVFTTDFKYSRTSSAWPSALTLLKICTILPSGPMMKVVRATPVTFLPYIFFCTTTP